MQLEVLKIKKKKKNL